MMVAVISVNDQLILKQNKTPNKQMELSYVTSRNAKWHDAAILEKTLVVSFFFFF